MTDAATLSGTQGELFGAPQPEKRGTMVLVDGHALAYRAYFALIKQNFRTKSGEPTGAVYGFVNMLLSALGQLKPRCLAVCFDMDGETFRDQQYAGYKAQRRPMPDDLRPQIDTIRNVVRAFGLPIYELPGYEADDVIATVAFKAVAAGFDVKILTGDRDIFQIVQPGITVLMPRTGVSDLEEYDAAGVLAKMGVRPDQIVDYKGLAGDTADNIPGVPGVGEKTAVSLLTEFGSFSNLFANVEKVAKPKLREALEQHREQARLSYDLARIDTAAPVEGLDWLHCEVKLPEISQLSAVLERLEFKTLLRDLPRRLGVFVADPAGEAPGPESVPDPDLLAALPGGDDDSRPLRVRTCVVDTPEALGDLVARLRSADLVAFDTETDSLSPLACNIVGISVACGPADANACDAYYVPVGHREGRQLPRAEVLAALRPIFEDPAIPKVAHHAKFDVHALSTCGIAVAGLRDDTLIAAYVLDAGRSIGLKDLARDVLGYRMTPISELIGKAGPKQKSMVDVDIAAAAPYAAADAAVALELDARLRERLSGETNLELYRDLEIPLIPVLWRMEQHGIRLDTGLLADLSVKLAARIREIEREARDIVGHDFNLGSPKQLETILFDKLQLPSVRKNKTGRSTDAAVLEELQNAHPVVGKILEFRQLTKLKNTYLDVLPTYINERTGCVHTSYNQHVAATGRLSSDQPNLQNIPIRTDLGREIRRAFVPREPGNLILSADYSQIELRILAHVADDEAFKRAFAADQDIHAATAAEIFGVPLDQVTSEMRRKAKAVNFGVAYGQTAFGLARALGIPQKEARDFIDAYRQKYAGVHRYTVETVAQAHRQGYVSTLLGRKRKLAGINGPDRQLRDFAERAAINAPIQGSAADLIKLAMLEVERALAREGLRTAMVLQVHDELVFEVPPQEMEAAKALVKREMELAMRLSVPLKVDLRHGPTWMEAK
ncbi:MAG: DNA polymerase I [Candidatus Sericytochromatia bacterium]|nr:DNA polymerase I [Candidatus Tanganyikabacteria bacterium]